MQRRHHRQLQQKTCFRLPIKAPSLGTTKSESEVQILEWLHTKDLNLHDEWVRRGPGPGNLDRHAQLAALISAEGRPTGHRQMPPKPGMPHPPPPAATLPHMPSRAPPHPPPRSPASLSAPSVSTARMPRLQRQRTPRAASHPRLAPEDPHRPGSTSAPRKGSAQQPLIRYPSLPQIDSTGWKQGTCQEEGGNGLSEPTAEAAAAQHPARRRRSRKRRLHWTRVGRVGPLAGEAAQPCYPSVV